MHDTVHLVADVLKILVHHSEEYGFIYSSKREAGEASKNVHGFAEPVYALVVIVVGSTSDSLSSFTAIDQVDSLV